MCVKKTEVRKLMHCMGFEIYGAKLPKYSLGLWKAVNGIKVPLNPWCLSPESSCISFIDT